MLSSVQELSTATNSSAASRRVVELAIPSQASQHLDTLQSFQPEFREIDLE
jgi:hypothetical protein